MAQQQRLYKHFCMGEKCPAEKLLICGTTTPDTSLFLLGDQLPEATGHSIGLSGLMKCKYNFICFLTLHSKHLQFYKWKHCDSATSSASASFCQESEVTLWYHCDTAWLLGWCLRISGWPPQAVDVTALYLASCVARWSLHAWETSTGENFGQTEEKNMGPSSALESWVSVPDDPVELAVSAFVLCHRKAAGDAALASIKEQKAFQCSHHEPWAMSIWFNYLKEISGKAKDFDPTPSWKNTLENCWQLWKNSSEGEWWDGEDICKFLKPIAQKLLFTTLVFMDSAK